MKFLISFFLTFWIISALGIYHQVVTVEKKEEPGWKTFLFILLVGGIQFGMLFAACVWAMHLPDPG